MESDLKESGPKAQPKKGIKYNLCKNFPLQTFEGKDLKEVKDFKYLVSLIRPMENDVKARKSKIWKAINSMENIRRSNMPRDTKLALFRNIVESVLLYGCETWSLIPTLTKSRMVSTLAFGGWL